MSLVGSLDGKITGFYGHPRPEERLAVYSYIWHMSVPQQKPVIGVSVGDLNGIGTELIIKTFSDHRLLEFCTPLIFASNKLINFYRKFSPEMNFNYQSTRDFSRVTPKQINIYNCWEEEIAILPG